MSKRSHYETFIGRLDLAVSGGHFLEASWYAYAVLEDRLLSLLRGSGGVNDRKGKPFRPLGNKLRELQERSASDDVLRAHFEFTRLHAWKVRRDELMHAMADASKSVEEIDGEARRLAMDGAELVRVYSAASSRFKKRRRKALPGP